MWQMYREQAHLARPINNVTHFAVSFHHAKDSRLILNDFSRITISLRDRPNFCNPITIIFFFMFSKLHLRVYGELLTSET